MGLLRSDTYASAGYVLLAYVDWIGLDAYNRLDDAFANTFTTDPSYGYPSMTAHAKPLLIGETGAYDTNESHQITFLDAAASVLQTNFPQLLGFMYFDAGGADDWSLSTLGATNGVTVIVMRSPLLQAPLTSHLGFFLLRIKEAGRSEAIS